MRDEAAAAVIIMAVLVCSAAWSWSTVSALDIGRCQSACWLAGYTYTSTDATACLCDNAGVPVAVNIPKEPSR